MSSVQQIDVELRNIRFMIRALREGMQVMQPNEYQRRMLSAHALEELEVLQREMRDNLELLEAEEITLVNLRWTFQRN